MLSGKPLLELLQQCHLGTAVSPKPLHLCQGVLLPRGSCMQTILQLRLLRLHIEWSAGLDERQMFSPTMIGHVRQTPT